MTTCLLMDMSLHSSSKREFANSLPPSDTSCCIVPRLQIHSSKTALATVMASLLAMGVTSVQFVKAQVITATYLCLLSPCRGPKRSMCTLSLGLWQGGHGVSSAFFGGRWALWHWLQFLMNSLTSCPIVCQKYDSPIL